MVDTTASILTGKERMSTVRGKYGVRQYAKAGKHRQEAELVARRSHQEQDRPEQVEYCDGECK